jgi:mRNA interferase RelE/StbE
VSVSAGRYVVIWARPARRGLERLPEKVAAAAIEFIYGPLADQPRRVGHALRFELAGLHSAARGDHRIIYRIDEKRQEVIIEVIEHRADVYRPR